MIKRIRFDEYQDFNFENMKPCPKGELDYLNIVDYHKFIQYACETCDTFCLSDNSEYLMGLDCVDKDAKQQYHAVLQNLEPYLVRKEYICDRQSTYTGTCYLNTHICHYKCCPETETILLEKNSVFDWSFEVGSPEELCFFREENVWYYCITHEEHDGLLNYTQADIDVLDGDGIMEYNWLFDDYAEMEVSDEKAAD